MPAESEKQRKFMGARLAEQRKSGHNSTGMSEGQLRDFARKPVRGGARKSAGRKRGNRY
jgi:hypothetical protein